MFYIFSLKQINGLNIGLFFVPFIFLICELKHVFLLLLLKMQKWQFFNLTGIYFYFLLSIVFFGNIATHYRDPNIFCNFSWAHGSQHDAPHRIRVDKCRRMHWLRSPNIFVCIQKAIAFCCVVYICIIYLYVVYI